MPFRTPRCRRASVTRLAEAVAHHDAARSELQAARADAERVGGELDAARSGDAALQEEVAQLADRCQALEAELTAAAARLAAEHERVAALAAEADARVAAERERAAALEREALEHAAGGEAASQELT